MHGGGWNGGTENSVPDASVYSGLRYLSDELGVIHVGLAYRCKLQGEFQDGLEDLRVSIKWFEERAENYGADLSKVGFSGGSAGTPLSALLAQEMPTCQTYTGFIDEANGVWSDQRKRTERFTYKLKPGSITITVGDSVTVLSMQHDGRALYNVIENDIRRTGQRIHFRKQPKSG